MHIMGLVAFLLQWNELGLLHKSTKRCITVAVGVFCYVVMVWRTCMKATSMVFVPMALVNKRAAAMI